jgi:hypothetical protein
VGHWEGDTLVVDVTGFNDKTWLGNGATIHSDALHVVERYQRVDYNTITYNVTWKIRRCSPSAGLWRRHFSRCGGREAARVRVHRGQPGSPALRGAVEDSQRCS